MRFVKKSFLYGTLLGLSLYIPDVLAESVPVDRQKSIAPFSQALEQNPCSRFVPLTNTVSPTVPETNAAIAEIPDSTCAKDLAGVGSPFVQATPPAEPIPAVPPSPENPPPQEEQGWQIKFQPYATIPISTYGTATARGRTVNYSLDLGEVLQSLRVTGSARIEAWNGRFGLIFDGYYVSLKNVIDLQRTTVRQPNFIESLNWLLSRDANGRIQTIINNLDRTLEKVDNLQELKNEQVFQDIRERTQDLQENVQQKTERLGELQQQIDQVRQRLSERGELLPDLEIAIRDLPNFDREKIRESSDIRDLRRLNEALEDLRNDPSLGERVGDFREFKDKLNNIKESLARAQERLQQIPQSEPIERLQEQIQNTREEITQVEQRLQQVQEFAENSQLQQLAAESETDLQFDQGIYDFAVSYHLGDLPSRPLPDRPTNRAFPLIWFQPYAGVRLNSLQIDIEQTLTVQLSSTLVNSTQTFEQNFSQGRTWFEPLLGGTFGVQVSDPITLWIRGDASGFGLAGDTDLSWNLLFGVDWRLNRAISLQFAYRFYGIEYGNGSGDNAFGFTQNLNGPYLAATFHF
jgi:hypothetical protein